MKSTNYGTTEQYIAAFSTLMQEGILPKHLALLQAHYDAPAHTATWLDLAKAVDYPDSNTVNLQYGTLAGRVAKLLGINEKPKGFWLYVLAEWADEKDEQHAHQKFVLRRSVINALTRTGIIKVA